MIRNEKGKNTKLIILGTMSFFIVLIIIFVITALTEDGGADGSKTTPSAVPVITKTPSETYENEKTILGVVNDVNAESYLISLIDVDSDEAIILTYTGGTQVLDKYDKVLSAKQLNMGEMVDVIYNEITKKAYMIKRSSKGWEAIGVKGLLINNEKQILTILNRRYRYSDSLLVIDNEVQIELTGFVKKDVVTIRGYGQKIYSVVLTRGHGYLKLSDEDAFIGGNIYVGGRMWEQITENMLLTVIEGEYDITVEFGDFSGTKTVKIPRNEVVSLSVGEFGPEAQSLGRAYFTILPVGAALYIDGVRRNYEGPVELVYGTHSIEVTMGGYQSYKGSISIDRTENQFSITLSENLGGEEQEEQEEQAVTITGIPTPAYGQTPTTGTAVIPTSRPGNNDDNTSEVAVWIDTEHTITVTCTSGTEVYFDGNYVGEIANGTLVVPKYIGTFDIDLYLEGYDSKSYTMEFVNDGENEYLNLPGFY